jgi:hypothetical protein
VLSPFGTILSPINGPNATATVNAGSATMQAVEGTASAATAAANAQATASAQASATAAVNANPYDPAGMGKLKLSESLVSNSSSQWDVNASCAFTKGSYNVIGQATSVQMCIAHRPNFSDFTFQVQMKISSGTGGGILFGAAGSAGYYFRITKDGYYALFACAGADCSRMLISNSVSSYITQGLNQPNLLAVVGTGKHIELYVSNQPIDGVDVSSPLNGQIGFVAEAGSKVVFNEAKVWTS